MTDCTRECPPDCLAQKLEMARRIDELEKERRFCSVCGDAHRVICPRENALLRAAKELAHPNQSIGEQIDGNG